MRALALIALATACGNRAAPTPAPPAEPIAAPRPDAGVDAPASIWPDRLDDDAAALALWRRLGVTGDTIWDVARSIPKHLQEPMARAILRDGHFDCPTRPIGTPMGCNSPILEFVPVELDAGFDDPCVRRELAHWATVPLDSEDLAAMPETVAAIASLPVPEEQLVVAVLDELEDEAFFLRMLEVAARSGNDDAVESVAMDLESPTAIIAAAAMHIDNAVARGLLEDFLSPADQLVLALAALRDGALEDETRTWVARYLAERHDAAAAKNPARAEIAAALAEVSRDPRCAVAGAAIGALASVRDEQVSIALPKRRTPATFARRLCEVSYAEGDVRGLLRAMTGGKSLVVRYVLHFADGDLVDTERLDLTGDFELPFDDDQLRHCDRPMCPSLGGKVYLRLYLDDRKKRRLRELETYSIDIRGDCTAPPAPP